MPSIINTNITSLVAQNNLSMTQATLQTTIERLSSGLRVNSASDDASGYAIANRMDSQIRGMAVATRNANDAISFSQTTSGALSQISNNLQRMRELAVQAANGSNSASDTNLLNQEFTQLQTEVARIQASTNFNNVNVFQANDIIFQVGANTTSGDRVNMQGSPLISTQAIATNTITESTANSAFTDISSVIAAAGTASSTISSVQNAAVDAINSNQRLTFANKSELLNAVNLAASSASGGGSTFATNLNNILSINGSGNNNVMGKVTTFGSIPSSTTVTGFTTSGTKAADNQIVAKAAAAAGNASGATLASVYAATVAAAGTSAATGSERTAVLTELSNAYTAAQAGGGMTAAAFGNNLWTTFGGGTIGVPAATTFGGGQVAISTAALEGLTPTTSTVYATAFTATAGSLLASNTAVGGQTNALNAIITIDAALTEVNTASATQGALQNRFSAVISNLTSFSQSQTAAKSRIVDADFAAETAKLSKNQILQQAGTAMLAQANQLPSGILSLLKNG
jgi:flagellin